LNNKKSTPDISSALRLLFFLVVSLFIFETVIKLVEPMLKTSGRWADALLDSASLVILSFPIIYYFCYQPMVRQIHLRNTAEEKLQEVMQGLEVRIQERTDELKRTNQELELEIRQRQQMETELRESESRFRTLIQQASEGIVLVGEEGQILEWNHAMQHISGISRSYALGEHIWDLQYQLMPSEQRLPHSMELFKKFFTHIADTGGLPYKKYLDVKIQTPDGSFKSVTQTIFSIKTTNGYRFGSIVLDTTERKRAEDELRTLNDQLEQRVIQRTEELNHTNAELERANRAKDEFLANMSHELRTPLNSILGLSESLLEQRRDLLTERQQRSLQLIEASGHHLLEMINDILDLAKIEAGKLDFYPEILAVDEICYASLAFVKSQAAKKSIGVTYVKNIGTAKIHADPRRLKQILVNLLTNAVKFTPERGKVTLQVEGDLEEELIRFSVIDTGIGIASEDLSRLFQPFTQVESSLNRQQEGTGLGLVLVQRLTDLHGGSVHVESRLGQGSNFMIHLPWQKNLITQLEAIQAGGEAPTLETTPSLAQPEHMGIVLLVEDNLANILTIGDYIESHGYEVKAAHDGLEALQMAEEIDPDIILMDIQMPVMDGLEAMRHLRANPRFVSTPIISLTAFAMNGDRERCLQAGANEYMSKPVSLKALAKTIAALLHTRTGLSQ